MGYFTLRYCIAVFVKITFNTGKGWFIPQNERGLWVVENGINMHQTYVQLLARRWYINVCQRLCFSCTSYIRHSSTRWHQESLVFPHWQVIVLSINLLCWVSSFRFSALLRDKPLCSSWNKKMEAKREKERVKNYTSQLKEHKIKQKEVI